MSSSQFMEKENSDGASSMNSYIYQENQIENEDQKKNGYFSSGKSFEN